MNEEFTIDIYGEQLTFIVENYEPPTPARINCDPNDSEDADPGSIEWRANTGSKLFDNYINDDPDMLQVVEIELEKAIQRAKSENEDQWAIEDAYLNEVYS